jgi:acetylornithine deacetylase/succinyl-diaminopimelate desuccinylase-like protein
VPNPAWRLAWALSTLKDADERILIDGFYDGVQAPTVAEIAALELIPDDSADTLSRLGLQSPLRGVTGVDYQRRHLFEPTCNIAGLTAGYQGPGSKTVLPARASAKVDFRLVVDQDPDELVARLRRHLDGHGFSDIVMRVHATERAGRTPLDDPFVGVAQAAAVDAYGREAVVVPTMAATGPMYHFIHDLGLPSVMAGINYVGGRDHAPDEHFRIEDFRRGTKHVAAILHRFGAA